MSIRGCTIYLWRTSFFTITNYPGVDPETSNSSYSLIGDIAMPAAILTSGSFALVEGWDYSYTYELMNTIK